MDYRCMACGSDRVGVSAARPSLDERYVLGTCLPCKKPQTLVAAPLYDRQKTAVERERARVDRADAMRAVSDPKHKSRRKLTPERAALGKAALEELAR